ncbi:class I SAM-dependent methyltransferase [Mesorhizobium sp. M0029]|uniref:class I SAM-dependent methyltransferase n=1 Tax=Mesorhizobium sp. M0029 TaxID=2956850 RepID=UPI003337E3D6
MNDEIEYGENWAPVYGEYASMSGKIAETHETVALLKQYSHEGAALELGIGDGRVAVPLSESGVKVEGIDNSGVMLKLLNQRTNLIKTWKGDISHFTSERPYELVFCVYGTFTLLPTREDQIDCLRSAAEALSDQGVLVIEMDVPALDNFVGGHRTTVRLHNENILLSVQSHDPINQSIISRSLWFSGESVRRLPTRVRYVYHQELDTMAECVGLKLSERWGDWRRGAFTGSSNRHISVYRRIAN